MGKIEADFHLKLAVRISALFGTGAVYPTYQIIHLGDSMEVHTELHKNDDFLVLIFSLTVNCADEKIF